MNDETNQTGETAIVEQPTSSIEKVDRMTLQARKFADLFREFVPFLPENPKILSVGCGAATEARGILEAFPGAQFQGIDIDPKEIERARRYNSDLIERASFREADATVDESYGDEKWDMILFRNPNVLEGSADLLLKLIKSNDPKDLEADIREDSLKFARMTKPAVRALKKGGALMVTTWHERELERAHEVLLENADIQINVVKKTKFEGDNDQYAIIAKKHEI